MPIKSIVYRLSIVLLLALCLSSGVAAQSTDITVPTPIRRNEVQGAILPRDLGDARLTDHFYIFTGTPGDLLLTVEGRNLNGDVDVFTASGLKPLLKFSLYAGSTSPVTKSIFLRRREDLVLRVEARTPNDEEGNYRLFFGGAFEPIPVGMLTENDAPRLEPEISAGTGRRVSSVGARIEEPPAPEVAAAPTPEPTPESSSDVGPEAKPAESPSPAETEVVTTPPRTPRGRRQPGRRTRTPQRPPAEQPPATTETEAKPAGEETTASEPAPRRGRRGGTARRTEEPAAAPEQEVETGPTLVIETNDGTLINRSMSTVRRVIVESGQVVVVGKDGRIQRIALANVVKMSIAP